MEGMTIPIITNEEELNNFINSLSEDSKQHKWEKGKKISGDTTGSTASHAQYFSIWNKSICNGNEYDNASVGYCKGQDTITKVIISPGIEEIESGGASSGVFTYSTALKEIIIPDTVVKIDQEPFGDAKS